MWKTEDCNIRQRENILSVPYEFISCIEVIWCDKINIIYKSRVLNVVLFIDLSCSYKIDLNIFEYLDTKSNFFLKI